MRAALVVAIVVIVLLSAALVLVLTSPAQVSLRQPLPCSHCLGSGLADCPRCEAGWIISDSGQVAPCPRCAGQGHIACTWCNGTGRVTEF